MVSSESGHSAFMASMTCSISIFSEYSSYTECGGSASKQEPLVYLFALPSPFRDRVFPCALHAIRLLSAGVSSLARLLPRFPSFLGCSNDAGGAFAPPASFPRLLIFARPTKPSRDFLVFLDRPGLFLPLSVGRVIFCRLRGAAGGCAVPRPVSSSRPSCAAIWRGRAFWHSDGFPGSWRAVWLR